jgi:ERCC4-related helicase
MPSPQRTYAPGMRVLCRDAEWMVTQVKASDGHNAEFAITCTGADDLVRGHEAVFLTQLDDIIPVDPRETALEPDQSPGFEKAKLFLEAQLRQMPFTDMTPSLEGMGAFKPMGYQVEAVDKALRQMRPRLLLADAVGLGKTIEIGMILTELIARGRGNRILVLTKKSMLTQFQSELWNRFAVPLVRLDSAGIAKLRLKIPASKNPFEVFHRVIMSIDTLKDVGRYRPFLEKTRWDMVIIDEAHNVAGASSAERVLSYRLAKLMSRSTDSMLLATATPHNGKRETFARLISLLDPSAIPDPKLREYDARDIAPFFLMRFKEDVRQEAGDNFSERVVIPLASTTSDATPAEEAVYADLAKLRAVVKEHGTKDRLIEYGLYKRFLSSPEALTSTITKVRDRVAKEDAASPSLPLLNHLVTTSAGLSISASSRYQLLKRHLQELGWDGSASSPRLLLFTESTVTQKALAEALARDFRLKYSAKFEDQPAQVLATIHGGLPDVALSATIESFGTGNSKMRMLLATDVASEGVNLHHECHHIIHYDLPWSIITLIQRNGRIDRFGQKREPQLRYLLVKTQAGLLQGDTELFDRLIKKVEEINRSTRTGESILRLYDAEAEEEYLARKGLIAGDAEVLQRAESTRWNDEAQGLEAMLLEAQKMAHALHSEQAASPVASAPAAASSSRLRLYPDRDFLSKGYDYLRTTPQGQQLRYQPLQTSNEQIVLTAPQDLARRLGAKDARGDVILGANAIPEEAWPEHGQFRLTHKSGRVQQAIQAAFQTSGFWSAELLHSENHPVMRWLVERMVMQIPRGSAPIIASPHLAPGEKCFCFIGQVSSRAGIPLIADAHAISFLPGGKYRHRPLREALEEARFLNLTNTGRASTFNANAMRGFVTAAVESSLAHMKMLRDIRRGEIRPQLEEEEKRLRAWYDKRKALQMDLFQGLAGGSAQEQKAKREIEEMDRYIKDRNTHWRDAHYVPASEPVTRLVLVIESTK